MSPVGLIVIGAIILLVVAVIVSAVKGDSSDVIDINSRRKNRKID